MAIYVPIVMYGLRLFIVVLQELDIVYQIFGMFIIIHNVSSLNSVWFFRYVS